jgi:hypothetical protein
VPTLRSQGVFNHIPFNQEREKFNALNSGSQKAQETIQSFYKGEEKYLAVPADKRQELKKAKEAIE